jgi:hypothetical protein
MIPAFAGTTTGASQQIAEITPFEIVAFDKLDFPIALLAASIAFRGRWLHPDGHTIRRRQADGRRRSSQTTTRRRCDAAPAASARSWSRRYKAFHDVGSQERRRKTCAKPGRDSLSSLRKQEPIRRVGCVERYCSTAFEQQQKPVVATSAIALAPGSLLSH